jgi:integrase
MAISDEMLDVFKAWRKASQFTDSTEWMFASPVKLGRLPVSYPYVLQSFQAAAKKAKLDRVSTHCMRHTYRAWLDAVGTPIAVQQKLMRHADIRTTMNTYGDVVTDQEAVAHGKVVEMALRRAV